VDSSSPGFSYVLGNWNDIVNACRRLPANTDVKGHIQARQDSGSQRSFAGPVRIEYNRQQSGWNNLLRQYGLRLLKRLT
jgi:hypothetical protein